MVKDISQQKQSFLSRFSGALGGKRQEARDQVARLEAFLAAFPGEYCGWGPDGMVAYSQGFCEMLGLEGVQTLSDVQARLAPSDAAALEGIYERLEDNALPFAINVRNADASKILRVSGSQGCDVEGDSVFNILWLEDVTTSQTAYETLEEKAAETDKRFRWFELAFNSILSPRWLRDSQGKLIWVNKAYSDIIGHTARDIVKEQKELAGRGRKASGKDKVLLGADLGLKATREDAAQSSQTHVNVGGERLLMRVMEVPMKEFSMTLGVAEDITKQGEVQAEMERHLSSNKELLEQLHSAISIYSVDQRLEFYNSAFAQLWGLEDGWLNTKPKLGEVMEKLRETRRLPEQADFRTVKESWKAMFTALIGPHEEMLYLPDGSAVRLLVIPHSMGGLMMNFEDVTSRLELESSYNTLIAVQKETLDNLGEAVAVYGGDGRLKLSNPSFGRLWKLNPEDLEGEPHINTIVEKVKGFFADENWAARREELLGKALDRTMHEGRMARIDDTHIDYSTVPLPDGGVLVTYGDVTDTVRVENALRDKNAALEDAERLKLDFLANVSYQLRTPLNAIMGFNEILDQEYFGKLNDRQRGYTKDMHTASEKLLGLVDDVLDLATLEAGYMELQREDMQVVDFLNAAQERSRDWARKANVEVHVKCPKNVGKFTVDRKRLKQAVINVIRNAINFTPEHGRIDLIAKRLKDGIEIKVKDNGVGVKDDDRKRIFEPFERAQSTAKDTRFSRAGAGLGLALVKNIVALHDGRVDFESTVGKGTVVTIFVPFTSVETCLKITQKA
jgi:signal transduction histidine kinase